MNDRVTLRPRQGAWLSMAAIALTGAVLWTVAGWHRLPLVEGWSLLPAYQTGSTSWWLSGDSPLGSHSGRPLELMPAQLGFILDGTSFFGTNLLGFICFVAKAMAARLYLRELLSSREILCLVGAVAFALSPAADGALIDRGLHIQMSSALFLAGLGIAAIAHRRNRPLLAGLAGVSTGAGLLIYENGYLVAAAAPVLVWLLRPIPWRQLLRVWSGFLAVIAACAFLAFVGARREGSYQQLVATTQTSLLSPEGLAAVRQAITWESGGYLLNTLRDSLPMSRPTLSVLAWLVMLGCSLGASLAALRHAVKESEARPVRHWALRILVVSAVWTAASLAPYITFSAFWYDTLRVHSLAQFGPVILVVGIADALLRRGAALRVVGALAVGSLLFASAFATGAQALMWRGWSDFQSSVISSVVAARQANPTGPIVVYDESERLQHLYSFGPSGGYLPVAYRVVTQDRTSVFIVCTTGMHAIVNAPGSSYPTFTDEWRCRRSATALAVLDKSGREVLRVADSQAVSLSLQAGSQPQLKPILGTRMPANPSEASTFLPCHAGEPCADGVTLMNTPQAPFDLDVSLRRANEDVPDRSFASNGFGMIRPSCGGWARWTSAPEASVVAQVPAGTYRVRFVICDVSDNRDLQSVGLKLDGRVIDSTRTQLPDGWWALDGVAVVEPGGPALRHITITSKMREVPGESTPMGVAVTQVSMAPAP